MSDEMMEQAVETATSALDMMVGRAFKDKNYYQLEKVAVWAKGRFELAHSFELSGQPTLPDLALNGMSGGPCGARAVVAWVHLVRCKRKMDDAYRAYQDLQHRGQTISADVVQEELISSLKVLFDITRQAAGYAALLKSKQEDPVSAVQEQRNATQFELELQVAFLFSGILSL